MFKLESYVTPLLLSYVNKYIKNLKPEDSQVSLWGGDAVFNNLDLRIDVLEQELALPFTFVNGHIHELRIHVPWTKLGSEPIIITINTIECILKLKDEIGQDADAFSTGSGASGKGKESKKKVRRQELEETPSSYVQSLISRIVNNISIVCNNLILKYVEDDIVLSLNVKSVQIVSANELWEKAFIDLAFPELVLRKLIHLHDLTVCLDRRNGSGKIETYQDPLLYRCSLEGRLYMAFDSAHGKVPAVTRLDVSCDKLEFSITDQQLPMFVRLLQLCIALYFGELDSRDGDHSNLSVADDDDSSVIQDNDENYDNDESWGSWAWSMIPQILPEWEDDDEANETDGLKLPLSIAQFGLYVKSASFIFKLSESLEQTLAALGTQKLVCHPFACLYLEEIFGDVVLRNPDSANFQMGIQAVRLASLGDCVCKNPDAAFVSGGHLDPTFFVIGNVLRSEENNHLQGSLFSNDAPENKGQRRTYSYEWEEYFNENSEHKMLSRSQGFAADFFYFLELPEEASDKASSINFADLEYSGLKERCIIRAFLNKPELNISSALVHRWQKFLHCIGNRDYEPYCKSSKGSNMASAPTAEDVAALEAFIPFRAWMIAMKEPLIRILPADHPAYDVTDSHFTVKKKKKGKLYQTSSHALSSSLPIIVLTSFRFESYFECPMYPSRVVRTVTKLCLTSEILLYHCHSHLTFKLSGFEVNLHSSMQLKSKAKVTILPACSGTYYVKELLLQEQWKNPFQLRLEHGLENSRMLLRVTWPQILLVHSVYKSWCQRFPDHRLFENTSLVEDALSANKENCPNIEILITGMEWKFADSEIVYAHNCWIGTLRISLHHSEQGTNKVITLIHGPEEKGNIHKMDFFKDSMSSSLVDFMLPEHRLFNFILQLPKNNIAHSTASAVLLLNVKGLVILLDPMLYVWLSNIPTIYVCKTQTTEMIPAIHEESSEVRSKVSMASSTPVTAHSENHTQSCSHQGKTDENTNSDWFTSEYCIKMYLLLRKLVIQVSCESCTLFIPASSIKSDCCPSSMMKSYHKAFGDGTLPDVVVVNLPQIILHNEARKQSISLENCSIPITELDGWNLTLGDDLFPWSLKLAKMSVYTVFESKEMQPVLLPTAMSATFALTTKSILPMSDKLSQLGLCVHVDMDPFHLSFSQKQVHLMSVIIRKLLEVLRNQRLSDNTLGKDFGSSSHSRPTSFSHSEAMDIITLPTISEQVEDICAEKINQTDSIKLSFWLQWTLPKFMLDLITTNDEGGIKVQCDVDELIVSIDVQEVYSKMKLKISSLNCFHFENRNKKWVPGIFEGLIFSCSNKLVKTIQVLNLNSYERNSSKCGLFESNQPKTNDANEFGFLRITFTRAQCKNVHKRWNNMLRESSQNHPDCHIINVQSMKRRYVSEIDVKAQPFDVVLCGPVLLKGLKVLEPFLEIGLSGNGDVFDAKPCDETEKTAFMLGSNTLPLLYLNINTMRVFGPVVTAGGDGLVHELRENTKTILDTSHGNDYHQSQRDGTLRTEDLILLEIDSIHISPQVDNPLFRIVLRSDVYNLAQQAHITNIPGSHIEDRQYQLDISGISLMSGSWDELIHASGNEIQPTLSSKLHTMGENPALEWNNKVLSPYDANVDEDFIPQFLPMISPFDLRTILAPAVIYNHSAGSENSKQDIICGHSLEVNVTTELDFYANLQQIALLSSVCLTNLSHITTDVCEVSNTKDSDQVSDVMCIKKLEITKLDSGIESDMSTLKTAIDSPSFHHALKETLSAKIHPKPADDVLPIFNPKHSQFIPYEILLTCGHISFSLYDVTDSKTDSNISSKNKRSGPKRKRSRHREHRFSDPSVWSSVDDKQTLVIENEHFARSTFHPNECKKESVGKFKRMKSSSLGTDGYEGSEESLDDNSDINFEKNLEHTQRIQPLFYLKFVQPHTFMKCLGTVQKLELSCFDIGVRAGSEKHLIHVTEAKSLPLPEDFLHYWLETKPGNIDSKTGIPPAFLTLTITDFFDLPANVKLKLERPMRLGFSISKYNMFLNTSRLVSSYLSPLSSVEAEMVVGSSESFEIQINNVRKLCRNIQQLDFSTVQLNIILETFPHKENSHLLFNISQISGNASLKSRKEGLADEVLIGLLLKEYLVKTSYNNKALNFLGPSSTKIGLFAKWEDWSLSNPLPSVCCNVENETLICTIGIDNLLCWKLIIEDLQKFVNVENDEKMTTSTDDVCKVKSHTQVSSQSWHDDLRIGTFQYIQDADDAGLQPEPYEIVFYREQAGQPASMTWCYPEPRILTRVEVYPVPFRAASDMTDKLCEMKDEVTCVLQYWDSLVMAFITYQKFQLSEVQHCTLELPSITGGTNEHLIIANKWRVVLDYVDDESSTGMVHRSLVSPLALAACMRVDSFFDPVLVPSFQLRMNIDMVNIVLSSHFQHSKKAPLSLQPFIPDDSMPNKQDLLSISFENISFNSNYGNGTLQTQLNSTVKMEVIEYCNLTVIPLLDLCSIKNHATLFVDKKAPAVLEIATMLSPLVLRISQSAIHTLGIAYSSWHRHYQNQLIDKDDEQICMNYYAICNDTQETIRFGQIDMDENIILHSREMHAYSWRTHKSKQLLHVCVEGMHWKWCEPFNIDTVGTVVRHMEHKGQKATLIIVVKALNRLQKQVLIRGPLHFLNFLNHPLEVKLKHLGSSNHKSVQEHCCQLASETTIATSIVEANHLRSLQVQVKNSKNQWSKEIDCNAKKNSEGILIQIPMLESEQMINAWCHFEYQPLSRSSQLFIIFAPMFIVQTNLPRSLHLRVFTPGPQKPYTVEIAGRGKEHQLHFPGNPEITHHLSFQISPELEESKPALPLSRNMISQVSKHTLPSPFDVEDFYRGSISSHGLDWPYNEDQDLESILSGLLLPASLEHFMKIIKSSAALYEATEQPNINLEVQLQQKWPYCNTLLISVKPWALIINQTSAEVSIKSEDQEWKIGSEKIFASPKLEGSIQVGILMDEKCYYSDKLELTNDDWTFRHHWPRSYNKLPMQGFSQIQIFIDGETKRAICYVTLNFKLKDGMQIIVIQSSYNIVNNSTHSLKLAPFVTKILNGRIGYLPENLCQMILTEKETEGDAFSKHIFLWEFPYPKLSDPSALSEYSLYLNFCSIDAGNSLDDWSLPCHLESKTVDSRFSIIIPKPKAATNKFSDLLPVMTVPLTVSMHELNGVFHFVITDDLQPQIVLYNSCSIPLYFGESLQNSSEEFGVEEETGTIQKLPCVQPNQACHYNFPSTMNKFPEFNSSDSPPKLRFANKIEGEVMTYGSGDYFHWSSHLDLSVENDVFLNIPNYSDVRVHIEKVGYTAHIFVEPVSRIEISAKEIRSRIKSKAQTYSPLCTVKMPTRDMSMPQNKPNPEMSKVILHDSDTAAEKLSPKNVTENMEKKELLLGAKCLASAKKHQERDELLIFFTLFMKHCSLIVMDTLTTRNCFREVVRINIDDLACSLRPTTVKRKTKIRPNPKQELVLCLGCLQIDNQLSLTENFDFSVILIPQNKKTDLLTFDVVQTPELVLQSVRNDAFLSIEVLVEVDDHNMFCVQNVNVSTQSMLLYIEDTFFYKLMEILPTFSICSSQSGILSALGNKPNQLPLEILDRMYAYHHPIRIQHLQIDSLSVMLSLHASLKLFISLDHTPLFFKPFQRCNVLTTSYPIGRALTVHYLSGALVRAGWVVGSLDLLGNPGGFARAVSNGMVDFVKLPYQGLTRGPWAFLTGIAHGSMSLVQQITAGTLVSITNLASSVSRNMEKLSLDETYRQQSEEIRRSKPDSVTQGFTQGLTGFGISLLGAVAGIIDQPMQTFQQSGNQPSFPVGTMTGLISGVSKGIVGIVTKPLGGAAELVSQAGQGILYGTGWNKLLEIKYNPTNERNDTFSNSQLKYAWKMLSDLPHTEIILSIEATQIIQSGNYIPSVLLLTSHVLFIVNIEEDNQQQAFSLSEVECVGVGFDPTLIYITPLNPKPISSSPPEEKQTRVEEFVTKTVKYLLQGPEESERSDSSSHDSPVITSSNASMHFHVHPNMRNIYLALFKVVRNNITNRGFPV